MSAEILLEELLDRRPELWRGRARTALPAEPSGLAWLDRGLPGGGWPRGRLTELLPRVSGCGELGLLLPLLARCTGNKRPVVLAGPVLVPGPQALSRAGVRLDRLLVLHRSESLLWAAEQCLKSGLCAAVVIWLPPGRQARQALRRLQLAAEQSPGPGFVIYPPGQQPPPSASALRLGLAPGPEVEILRSSTAGFESKRLAPTSGAVVDLAGRSDHVQRSA